MRISEIHNLANRLMARGTYALVSHSCPRPPSTSRCATSVSSCCAEPQPCRTVGPAWRPTSARKADFMAIGQVIVETLRTVRPLLRAAPLNAALTEGGDGSNLALQGRQWLYRESSVGSSDTEPPSLRACARNSSWSGLARHHPIDLVLAECRFAPLEPWRRRPTADFYAGTLTLALTPSMILQPEKRVQDACFWAFTLGEGLRSAIRQMSRWTRNWLLDVSLASAFPLMHANRVYACFTGTSRSSCSAKPPGSVCGAKAVFSTKKKHPVPPTMTPTRNAPVTIAAVSIERASRRSPERFHVYSFFDSVPPHAQ
jgi:hypothetical protein